MAIPINLPARITAGTRTPVTAKWANDVREAIVRLARRKHQCTGGGGGGGGSGICPFGELIPIPEDPLITSIRGGLIVCGVRNFNLQTNETDLEADGVWLVEISLSDIELGTDDDSEIFIGGVITSTDTPVWNAITYTGTESYTSTTNPADPSTPTGTIIIGLGVLTITDGVATFQATGCGTITVSACEGILAHSRG